MKFWFYTALILIPFGKGLSVRLAEAETKTFMLVPFDVVLGMLALSCILHAWSNRKTKPPSSSISNATLAFVLWAVCSLVFNVFYFGISASNAALSALYLIRWTECFSFFYASRQLVLANPKRAHWIVSLLTLSAVCFSGFGIIQAAYFPDFALMLNPDARPYIDFDPQGHRLVSTYLDPNIAAGYLSFFCLIALSMYMHLRKWLASFLLLGASLLLTLSRGGILGFIVGAAIILSQARKLTKGLVMIAGSLVLMTFLAYPFVKEEIEERNRISVTDDSAMMRLEHIATGVRIATSNLVTGVGFNTLGFVLPTFDVQQEGALSFGFDTDLLTVLVLTGITGLLLYLNIYRLVFRSARFVATSPLAPPTIAVARGVSAGTVGLLISSCFSQTVLFPAIMACMWTFWGLLEAPQIAPTHVTIPSSMKGSLGGALTPLPTPSH
jgi:hypothetical protein